jgi:hypothetical protein
MEKTKMNDTMNAAWPTYFQTYWTAGFGAEYVRD